MISKDVTAAELDDGRMTRNQYLLATALGRVTGKAVRAAEVRGAKPLRLRVLDRLVSPRISNLEPLDAETRDEVAGVLQGSAYWHGTGRYQYRDGQPVDVLAEIAQQGRLQPQYDLFDATGPMQSVSLARARIYARAYADMHNNRRENPTPERHGSAVFWATVFLGDFAVESAKEQGGFRNAARHLQVSGSHQWHAKISQTKLSILDCFAKGSDIPGNYPVLFGIADAEPAPTSRAIDIHEVRSHDPLALDGQITHIEVPRSRLADTQRTLAIYGYGTVPTYAIEDFERYAATLALSELMGRLPADGQYGAGQR